jgi:biopolymer transport protein ExbD
LKTAIITNFEERLNMRIVLLLLSVVIVSILSSQCGGKNNELQFSEFAKVKVTKTGEIFLNKKPTSMEELKKEFARLKSVNGAVMYHRENPTEEASPQAMAVIQAIAEAKLPVQLSEKDFE